MSLTIIQDIEDFIAAKNNVRLVAETDNFVVNAGFEGLYQIVAVVADEGENWIWSIDGVIAFTWTWRIAPNDTGLEISRDISDIAQLEWVRNSYMNTNPGFTLRGIYVDGVSFNGGTNEITLDIRVPAELGELSMASTVPGNISSVNWGAGQLRVINKDFRIICAVYEEDLASLPSTAIKLGELDANPNNDSIVSFNLKSAFTPHLTWFMPPIGGAEAGACVGMSKLFSLHLVEEYLLSDDKMFRINPLIKHPEGPLPDGPYDSGVKGWEGYYYVAIRSKVPHLNYDPAIFYSIYCTEGVTTEFLNHRPRVSSLHREEPVWLYFVLADLDGLFVEMNVKLYLADGSTDEAKIDEYLVSSADNHFVHYVSAGIANWAALETFIAGRDVTKYEFWLTDKFGTMDQVTEKFTFMIEDRDYDHMNFLVFESPLGGADTFRITGNIIVTDSATGDVAHLEEKEVASEDFLQMVNNFRQPGFIINTGLRKKLEEIEWLRDIYKADNVYLLLNGEQIKLVLDREEQQIHGLKDSLYSMTIKAKRAHYD